MDRGGFLGFIARRRKSTDLIYASKELGEEFVEPEAIGAKKMIAVNSYLMQLNE